MWTNRAHFIYIYIGIGVFKLPIVIPAFIINSLVTELCDLVNFFTFPSKKITGYVNMIEGAVHSACDFKEYDYVDIEAKSDKGKVKIKIGTR